MTLRRQFLIVIPLSLAAAWAGSLLAPAVRRQAPTTADGTAAAHDAPHRLSAARPGTTKQKDRGVREVIASASTDVLWNWIEAHGTVAEVGSQEYPVLYQVLRELYAREGLEAWETLLAEEEADTRETLSDTFLGMLSNDDPWLAYELFLRHKGSFGEEWGMPANSVILGAACAISAEKFIEVMERSGFKDTDCWFGVDLPAGFDFGRLVSHLQTSDHMPSGLPDNLIAKWAGQSPREAAEWLQAQPAPGSKSRMRYLLDEEMVYHNTLLSLAGSTAAGREEGLAAFARLPASSVGKTWDRLAEKQEGRIEATVLDAATRMGSLDDYLVASLMESRGKVTPDASWTMVPEQDRRRALDLAEQRWQSASSSPIDDKARKEWRARFEKAWEGR